MAAHALVIGESLIDVVAQPDGSTVEHPGGSAANVAVALARLGRPVRFATAFADDARGAVLARHLAVDGVELATDPHTVARTSSAVATLAADGSASYEFDLEWRLAPLAPALTERPRFVHVCSIGAVLAPGADAVRAALDALADADADADAADDVAAGTTTVLYDVNARPAITGTGPDVVARVEAVAARATLVKASDEDLAVLYPHLGIDAAAEHLRGLGPRAVVVTRGGEGATWFGDGVRHDVRGVATTVVDTIGAGDTFSAGILDALWSSDDGEDGTPDPAAVLAHAARAAAVTVSRPGADPPTRAELERARE